ncbi:5-formyltetrahydrofolate cyclo-ligase [Mycoplasma sp. SG1]|uniref:5-formyltetrahydrofolate cyclo-ligase n=1 Tax=Mycoplasma sp. SG1 TaxID=2810348 RepID=UPI002025B5A7|nr:5-formyltetrahydrofolate cyclo-ligase [Mycoplasma sp. SG1]URM52746.1 5-formyltetrahydrofolate cyclo-ligase [Mycoplasma sp. SG1]
MNHLIKKEIRSKYLTYRKEYSLWQLSIYNLVIFDKLIDYLKNNSDIRTIAFYWSINNEVDLKLFYDYCKKLKIICLLPACYSLNNSAILLFKKIEYNTFHQKKQIFFLRKAMDINDFPVQKIDLIICPLIAFNSKNYRIGYGHGYYDKALQKIKIQNPNLKTLGVAYHFQFSTILFQEKYDVQLDKIITN